MRRNQDRPPPEAKRRRDRSGPREEDAGGVDDQRTIGETLLGLEREDAALARARRDFDAEVARTPPRAPLLSLTPPTRAPSRSTPWRGSCPFRRRGRGLRRRARRPNDRRSRSRSPRRPRSPRRRFRSSRGRLLPSASHGPAVVRSPPKRCQAIEPPFRTVGEARIASARREGYRSRRRQGAIRCDPPSAPTTKCAP